MQRIEVQHHTPEQVREYVAQAIEIAHDEAAGSAMEEAVFVEAVRLLASKTVQAVAHPQGISLPGIGH